MRVCGCVGCVVHVYGDVLVEGTRCACVWVCRVCRTRVW